MRNFSAKACVAEHLKPGLYMVPGSKTVVSDKICLVLNW